MGLEQIKKPEDIKNMSVKELEQLAVEVREALLNRLSKKGGHFGPNFGVVEITIALHYVFNSPIDKIVYDISHQCYTHKILTGRGEGFYDDESFHKISGYTNPDESDHDFFKVGHTSTSVSLATGLAKARDLKGSKENIIALIGDGSLSGGEALEGLDYAGELGTNLIIVVNDNEMSIAENHGGLYRNLAQLRESKGSCPCNLFKAFGLDYRYVEDGHNLEALIQAFREVKDTEKPVVVHVHTVKGKGYSFAEGPKENWHWHAPFDVATGQSPVRSGGGEDYATITSNYFLDKMKEDPLVSVVVAGAPTNIGFSADKRKEAGTQFVDVGIAEEQGIAMVSGMAKNGAKPVFATHSSFMQRTYDQLSQDLCINKSPATVLVNTASIYGMSDVTHLGIFDIPMMSNIPNLVYLAPTGKQEYLAMIEWSLDQREYPVAIRIPCNGVHDNVVTPDKDYSELNRYQVIKEGSEIAILALGDFFQLGQETASYIEKELGITPTLINPRYITGVDEELLEGLMQNHKKVITLEDGILDGGFGEKIAAFYGAKDMKVYTFGLKKEFYDRYRVDDLMRANHLTPEQIVEDIK